MEERVAGLARCSYRGEVVQSFDLGRTRDCLGRYRQDRRVVIDSEVEIPVAKGEDIQIDDCVVSGYGCGVELALLVPHSFLVASLRIVASTRVNGFYAKT